jgi:hypothetical protein
LILIIVGVVVICLALIGAFVFLKTRQSGAIGNDNAADNSSKIEFNALSSNDSGYSAAPAPAQIYGAHQSAYGDVPPLNNKVAF